MWWHWKNKKNSLITNHVDENEVKTNICLDVTSKSKNDFYVYFLLGVGEGREG
jgi:hypothetical protein